MRNRVYDDLHTGKALCQRGSVPRDIALFAAASDDLNPSHTC